MSSSRVSRRFPALLGLFVFLVAGPDMAGAQDPGTVRGSVEDVTTGLPLRGAVIQVIGTSRLAFSAQDGSYSIAGISAGEIQVRATFIGYSVQVVTLSVSPGSTATANFSLRQTALELGGLVVIATGEQQSRRELGNSVANISVQEMDLGPIHNFQELLSARAPGVIVRSSGGTTGAGQRIRIRGANSASLSNEPLVILDGIQVTARGGQFISTASSGQTAVRMNDLNPEDIQSIEILRGPAASALYGTAGANGVIQITTRRGRTGDAQWNYYYEFGDVEDRNQFPDNIRAYGTGPTGARVLCPLFGGATSQSLGNCAPTDYETLNILKDPRTTPFRQGSRTRFGANVSGGSLTTTFYLSGDIEDEAGVYVSNELNRVNVRANVRSELKDGLSFLASSGYVSTRLTLPQNDNNAFSFILNGLLGGTSVPEEADPNSVYRAGLGPDVVRTRRETSETDKFTGSLNMNWQAASWLSATATGGVDYIGQHDHVLQEAGTQFSIFGSPFAEGFRVSQRFQSWVYNANASATANHQFSPDLRSTTAFGTNIIHSIFRRTGAFGAGLLGGTESLAGTSSLFGVEEQNQEVVTIGGLVRQQFSYRERLFLTGSLRGDDDSAFGDQAELALYSALSASWVVSEEDFFPSLPGLSSVRLRTAWGQSGLRPGFRSAETFFGAISVKIAGQETTGITVGGTGNPDLKVERTSEIEVGFDLGLLDERFAVEFTYYDKESKDALVSRRLAPSLGLTGSQFVNLAAVSNKGAELGLRGVLLDLGDVRLSFNASGSWNRNLLKELGEDVDDIIFGLSGDTQRHTPGHALGAYFQPRILGWEDVNNNGIIEPGEVDITDEAEFIGNPLPSRQISIAPELSIFNGLVRVTSLFDHQGGHHLYNATDDTRCSLSVGFFRCRSNFDPETPEATQARNASVFQTGTFAGFIEPGDFWKLREVTVTLRAPQNWVDRVPGGMGGLSLSLSGRNLKTWTNYSGIDPEVSFSGNQSNHTSADFFTQPPLRYLTARFSVNF